MTRWIALAALAFCACANGVEKVADFHSTIRIGADGVLTVLERIVVEAEGRDIQRGFLRDFPTDYRDRFGNEVKVPFEVVSVTRNGARETWSVGRFGNGERIRIGRADVLLTPGTHTYEITYRTARQVGHFSDHDELYWNVNGHGSAFPVDHISAEVYWAAKDKKQLPAGTYLGKCTKTIGLSSGPHCHMQARKEPGGNLLTRDAWLKWMGVPDDRVWWPGK